MLRTTDPTDFAHHTGRANAAVARPRAAARRRQSGITLIIALMLLTILTVAGLSVANISTVEMRIAQNETSALESFEAAESGLRRVLRSPAMRESELNPFVNGADPVNDVRNLSFPNAASGWTSEVEVRPLGPPMPCPISNVSVAGTDKCVFYEITSTSADGPGRGGERAVTGSAYVKVSDGDVSTFYTSN
ncbi:MAG: pilus assembly PilX N-terminal domain-containing protein [Pseudomonadota bacterium]